MNEPDPLQQLKVMFDTTSAQARMLSAIATEDIEVPLDLVKMTESHVCLWRLERDVLRYRTVRTSEVKETCEQGFTPDPREILEELAKR